MASKRIWGWVLLFMFLTGVPVLLAALFPPPGWRFLGSLVSPDDGTVYLSAMFQGTQGNWLYRSPYNPSPAAPLLMYLPYILLGHVAAPLQLTPILAYHLARLAGGGLALAVAWRWAQTLFEKPSSQRTAWLLVAFSSGLGWLVLLIPSESILSQIVDVRLPETTTFLSAFAAPHFILGVAIEALALLTFWRGLARERWLGWAVASGLSLLGLGLTYPFTLPVAYGVIGLCALWCSIHKERWRGRRVAGVTLVAGGIPLPFVFYYLQTFFFNPVWRATHVIQNEIPTPGLGWLVLGYGLPLALAVWGGVSVWRDREREGAWVLVSTWAALNGLLLYLPLPFRWRLANGWHFGLALMAARGVEAGLLPWLRQRGALRTVRRWSPRPIDTLRRVIVLLMVPTTLLVVLLGIRIALLERDFPYYVPHEDLRAMDELAGEVSFDDVVLGAYPTGNVLPSRALCRVVVGQQFATPNPYEKLEDVERFFDVETPDEERRAILERYGVTVVYYGRWEREMGAFDPGTASYLRELSRTERTVVYQVVER